jgi:CDP-diacylglycerol--glycerol-3-phosphate 3-phosphatidyltransferase
VLSALFTLGATHRLPWLPIGIIAVRELGITLYRSYAGRRGVSIPARRSAKVKTLLQDLAIATCLLPPLAPHPSLQRVMIWVAAAMTVVTGVEYVRDGRSAMEGT